MSNETVILFSQTKIPFFTLPLSFTPNPQQALSDLFDLLGEYYHGQVRMNLSPAKLEINQNQIKNKIKAHYNQWHKILFINKNEFKIFRDIIKAYQQSQYTQTLSADIKAEQQKYALFKIAVMAPETHQAAIKELITVLEKKWQQARADYHAPEYENLSLPQQQKLKKMLLDCAALYAYALNIAYQNINDESKEKKILTTYINIVDKQYQTILDQLPINELKPAAIESQQKTFYEMLHDRITSKNSNQLESCQINFTA